MSHSNFDGRNQMAATDFEESMKVFDFKTQLGTECLC